MKTVKSSPSTKQDIDNLYKKIKDEFGTKDYLKRFATKDDLRDELKKYATKDDIEDFKEEFNSKITEFKSEILDSVDAVMGEIKAVRENQEAHNFSHERIDDDLDDHETRIGKLEKTPATV